MSKKLQQIIEFKIMFILALTILLLGYKLGVSSVECVPCKQKIDYVNVQDNGSDIRLKMMF